MNDRSGWFMVRSWTRHCDDEMKNILWVLFIGSSGMGSNSTVMSVGVT